MKVGAIIALAIVASSATTLIKMKKMDDKYAETFDPQNPPLGHYIPPRKVIKNKIEGMRSK